MSRIIRGSNHAIFGEEITDDQADIYLRTLSEDELRSLSTKQDDWYNILVDGYTEDSRDELLGTDPDEEIETMFNLTAVACGTLKKYIKSEETYQGRLVCEECLRKICSKCHQLNYPFSDNMDQHFYNKKP